MADKNRPNINSASREEILLNVAGIDERDAVNIIQYRTEHGGFKNMDELVNVPGIDVEKAAKIRTQVDFQ